MRVTYYARSVDESLILVLCIRVTYYTRFEDQSHLFFSFSRCHSIIILILYMRLTYYAHSVEEKLIFLVL